MIIVIRYVNAAKSNGKSGGAARNRQGTPQAQGGKWTSPPPAPQRSQQAGRAAYSGQPAQAKGGYSQPMQPKGGMYSQPAQAQGAYGQSTQGLYGKLTQQTGGYSQQKKRAPQAENSILQKARANAAEHFDDDALERRGAARLDQVPQGSEIMRDKAMERHIHSQHGRDHGAELRNQPGVDDFDTYHLVDEVNDLIVKGYSGNLEFDRDFLAEGMDMLSRISM